MIGCPSGFRQLRNTRVGIFLIYSRVSSAGWKDQKQSPVMFAFGNPTLAQNARVGHPRLRARGVPSLLLTESSKSFQIQAWYFQILIGVYRHERRI